MATTDIVARLQLRAEQFSSETGSRFAELKTRARSAAQEVRDSFGGAFAEVQKLAQTSLQLPRTDTGSLNLAPEIAQLNAAAAAADQRALALRELSVAQTAAASGAGVDAAAMRLEADAAAVASLAEERNAQAIRDRVVALEAVQRELNQTASQTRVLTEAEQQASIMAQRGRGNFTMFGQQLNDFAVQVGSGQSAVTAFIQQFPQAAYALSTMEGGLGRVGAALTGPLGTGLTIALVLLTPLVAKLLEHNDAAGEARKKLQQAAEGADAFGDAEGYLSKAIDLTTGKLKTHNAVLIETVRLQALMLLQQSEETIAASMPSKARVMQGPKPGSMPVMGIYGGELDTAARASRELADQRKQLDAIRGTINTAVQNDALAKSSPKAYGDAVSSSLTSAIQQVDKLAASGAFAGKTIVDLHKDLIDLAKPGMNKTSALEMLDALNGKGVSSDLKPYHAPRKGKKARDLTGMSEGAEEEIARVNAEWDDQPRLIDKAFLATQRLDNLIADLGRKRPPGFKDLIADAEAAKQTIERGLITAIAKAYQEPQTLAEKGRESLGQLGKIIADLEARKPPNWEKLVSQAREARAIIEDGINRPFKEYVEQQEQSLAIGRLILEGRDAEAAAMQGALRIQERQGFVTDQQLETVLRLAEQQQAITRALEDQRRVVGLYTGEVDALQRTFDQFLENLDTKPGSALSGLVSGMVNDFKSLQRNIVSEQLFGGLDREIEDYMRQLSGKRTPAELIAEQAKAAGEALHGAVDQTGSELDRFRQQIRDTTAVLGLIHSSIPGAKGQDLTDYILAKINRAGPANDNGTSADAEIVVMGTKLQRSTEHMVSAVDAWHVISNRLVDNLGKLGIDLPASFADVLKKELPGVLQGASIFSSIGANFGGNGANIGGSIGAVVGALAPKMMAQLGPLAMVYQLGQSIMQPIAKSLGLDKTAVAIGGLPLGGLAKLFGIGPKAQYGSAAVTGIGSGGISLTGNNSGLNAASSGLAESVQDGLKALADQLGAQIGSFRVSIGEYKDTFRVSPSGGATNGKNKDFVSFGADQQKAVEYAIADAIRDGALIGISQASQNILRSGQDMSEAMTKALLIEAIPRDLKAMLDPVGAAVDALNLKWQKTVAALREGGATAAQMADAERLYNLQLEQVKGSTNSASQSLKDFVTNLKMGTGSSYSLRDQEATALAQLQPYLSQIDSGQSVDQDKYRAAAQSYLDIERQLYGSTQDYFAALDAIQASTNKAIAAIDNVTGLSPAVDSPFPKATADSTAATASNTATGNELLSQVSDQLGVIAQLIARMAGTGGGGGGGGFIGGGRNFVNAA